MARIDIILKTKILDGVCSNYTDKEIESDWCGQIIPILFNNRLRNMRATRMGTKCIVSDLQMKLNKHRSDNLKRRSQMNKKGLMVVEVAFISAMLTLTGITLGVPSIRQSFQVKRAIEICEFRGGAHCGTAVNTMSKAEVLEYIRDDAKNQDFYAPVVTKRRGGGLRARVLAMQ